MRGSQGWRQLDMSEEEEETGLSGQGIWVKKEAAGKKVTSHHAKV